MGGVRRNGVRWGGMCEEAMGHAHGHAQVKHWARAGHAPPKKGHAPKMESCLPYNLQSSPTRQAPPRCPFIILRVDKSSSKIGNTRNRVAHVLARVVTNAKTRPAPVWNMGAGTMLGRLAALAIRLAGRADAAGARPRPGAF